VNLIKTAVTYSAVSAGCLVITHVYALFGHGARSASMDWMFLYPLAAGAGVFSLLAFLRPRLPGRFQAVSRAGYNLYNSGIAVLTSAAMLTGIMEIAGGGSPWIRYIRGGGYILAGAAVICQGARYAGNMRNK
jgi:hypothetical protein